MVARRLQTEMKLARTLSPFKTSILILRSYYDSVWNCTSSSLNLSTLTPSLLLAVLCETTCHRCRVSNSVLFASCINSISSQGLVILTTTYEIDTVVQWGGCPEYCPGFWDRDGCRKKGYGRAKGSDKHRTVNTTRAGNVKGKGKAKAIEKGQVS